MLRLSLPKLETWNKDTEEFEIIGGGEIELEHSLYTVAAWEAKWKKPFADRRGLKHEEFLDYIMNFMCQTKNVSKEVWLSLTNKEIKQISNYMEDPMTATTVKHQNGSHGKRTIVTSELIYFYMSQFGIPFECEHWHLNRLMTLIDVCAAKNTPPKKMSKADAARQQAAQNAAMRKKFGSKG